MAEEPQSAMSSVAVHCGADVGGTTRLYKSDKSHLVSVQQSKNIFWRLFILEIYYDHSSMLLWVYKKSPPDIAVSISVLKPKQHNEELIPTRLFEATCPFDKPISFLCTQGEIHYADMECSF